MCTEGTSGVGGGRLAAAPLSLQGGGSPAVPAAKALGSRRGAQVRSQSGS